MVPKETNRTLGLTVTRGLLYLLSYMGVYLVSNENFEISSPPYQGALPLS